jgi:hypothetical protein
VIERVTTRLYPLAPAVQTAAKRRRYPDRPDFEELHVAKREIIVSDISGDDVPAGHDVRIVINEHPAISGPVELDASIEEAERFQSVQLELITLTIYEPGEAPRNVVMDAQNFTAALAGAEIDAVLANARRVGRGAAVASRSSSPTRRSAQPAKLDYTLPEHAGTLHRGRITEAEAAYVRDHLDEVNARLQRQGGRHIDPNDPVEKKRYGF